LFLVWRKNVQFEPRGGAELHVVPRDADAAVVALARRQHGVVTARQLLDAGVGPNAVTAKVERGWLRRVHRGVYAVGALESALTAPTAALATFGRKAILSHRTAAVLWRLLPARPDDPVDTRRGL
jgi:predicted transcriptional regulator of viral defense system